jgi:hypothetical protein
VLDPGRPIREADVLAGLGLVRLVPIVLI